jgi:hypothetical protein
MKREVHPKFEGEASWSYLTVRPPLQILEHKDMED